MWAETAYHGPAKTGEVSGFPTSSAPRFLPQETRVIYKLSCTLILLASDERAREDKKKQRKEKKLDCPRRNHKNSAGDVLC